ncbi:hypothetical protein [Methylomagnum sp.]
MKTYSAKIISAMVVALTLNTQAFADTYGGSLLKSAGSVARYDITCFDDGNGVPSEIYLDIQGRTKAATFLTGATIEKDGASKSVVDRINGDKKASPVILFEQGAGTYALTVTKVKKKPSQPDGKLKGVMVFSGTAHCLAASGAHTGTDIQRR